MAAENRRGKRVRRALGVAALVICAVLAGVASALWTSRGQFARGGVQNGAWRTNESIGSPAAGAYLRAGIAIGGLLALSKEETVYYTAFTDDAGAPLLSSCTYRVEARDPQARWWSITAYGPDHFLIPGGNGRYSVDKTRVEREAEGSFRLRVGGDERPANWISTGNAAQPQSFSLTLRLYNPEPVVLDDLAGIALPKIVKESCS